MRKTRRGALAALLALLCGSAACGDDGAASGPDDENDETTVGDASASTPDATKPRDARTGTTAPDDAAQEQVPHAEAGTVDAGIGTGGSDGSVRDAGHSADGGRTTDAGPATPDAGTNTCDALTYASFGQKFLTSYCVSCHGGVLAQKNVHLDTLAGVVSAKSKVKSEVGNGSMPPRGSKAPTAAERKQLAQWIDCGPK